MSVVPSRNPRPAASAVRTKVGNPSDIRQAAIDAAFAWLRLLEQKHPQRAPKLYRAARESMGILAAVEATARALAES